MVSPEPMKLLSDMDRIALTVFLNTHGENYAEKNLLESYFANIRKV